MTTKKKLPTVKKRVPRRKDVPLVEKPSEPSVNVKSVDQPVSWRNSFDEVDPLDPAKRYSFRGKDLRDVLRAARHDRDLAYDRVAKMCGFGTHSNVVKFFKGETDSLLRMVELLMVGLGVHLQYKDWVVGQDVVGVLTRVCEMQGKDWMAVAMNHAGMSEDDAIAMRDRTKVMVLSNAQNVMAALNVVAVFDEK